METQHGREDRIPGQPALGLRVPPRVVPGAAALAGALLVAAASLGAAAPATVLSAAPCLGREPRESISTPPRALNSLTAPWVDEITLVASRDNTLFLDETGSLSNGSGPALFAGNNSQSNSRRVLLWFDLSGLPADVRVEEVEIRLHVTNAPNTEPTTISVHRLVAGWGEGASSADGGSGAPAEPGDATWIHRFHPDSEWTSVGGDFDPAASSTAQVEPEGTAAWSGGGLVGDVRAWLEGTQANHGWILVGDETGVSTARRFGSREHGTAEFRPELRIRFVPLAPVLERSWGSTKTEWMDRDVPPPPPPR